MDKKMTQRERMLAAIRGEACDRIPFAPRMDLWHYAHRARGTLSKDLETLNMAELSKTRGTAAYAVRADYTRPFESADLAFRGLGLENIRDYPFRTELRDIPYEYKFDGENLVTTFHTPAGDITTHVKRTLQMLRDGISMPMTESYAIKSVNDFEAVAQIFEHLEVVPTPEGYAAFKERTGEQAVAVAAGAIAASPIHLMLHDLVAMDQFFYLYAEEREAMTALAERMTPYFDAVLDACVKTESETVFWGANYDQDLTWPPFFEEQIAPWLKKVSDRLHAAGKFLVTHCDGENKGLLPLYRQCGIDVAESVCPAPMTQCTLAELREGFGPNTTIFGGIPSVALLEDSMDSVSFEKYLDELFSNLGTGERLILGVSDNVPPDANLDRFKLIKDRIEAFGPVIPART